MGRLKLFTSSGSEVYSSHKEVDVNLDERDQFGNLVEHNGTETLRKEHTQNDLDILKALNHALDKKLKER